MTPTPYDFVYNVINGVRVRLNDELDVLDPISGQILDWTQPKSNQAFNSAWRRLQAIMISLGSNRFEQLTTLLSLPPTSLNGSVTRIGWNILQVDGILQPSPFLPQTLIAPVKLWERPTGAAGTQNGYIEMDRVLNSIPFTSKTFYNGLWRWHNDLIEMPGSTVSMDIIVEYLGYLPDFVTVVDALSNVTEWWQQQIPVMRSYDALCSLLCYEIALARDDQDAQKFLDQANIAVQMLMDQDTFLGTATRKYSELMRMKDKFTPQTVAGLT